MSNKKITELNAASSLAATDVVPVVDVSADETKKITATDLFRTLPDGTAAAPALAFSSDAANGVYLAGTDTVGISTGGTQRVTVDGSGNVSISGDLTVSGATTTVESTTVTIDDKNIELGSVASPSNTTADGGGITLKGGTDKTIKWINSTGYWTFNTGIEVGGHLQIDDSNEIRVGTGQDLKIFHASGENFIRGNASASPLYIDCCENLNVRHLDTDGGNAETMIKAVGDGAVELYHNGAKKFETKSDGIDVTGEVQCDSLDVDGAIDVTNSSAGSEVARFEGNYSGSGSVVLSNWRRAGGAVAGAFKYNDATTSMSFGTTTSHSLMIRTDDSDRLTIDSSGNVGIGDASPSSLGTNITTLEIKGGAATRSGGIRLSTSDDSQKGAFYVYDGVGVLGTETAHPLGLYTGNTERARIDSSGNVGIGTSSPTGYIHIEGASTGTETYGRFTTGPANGDQSLVIKSGSSRDHMAIQVSTNAGANDDLALQPDGGNVGIGTSSPTQKLSINGNLQFEANDGVTIGAKQSLIVNLNSSGGQSNRVFQIKDNGTARVTFEQAGNVGIGVTSPAAKLDVAGNIKFANSSSNFQADFVANNSAILNFTTGTSEGVILRSDKYLRLDTGGSTERLRLDSSGNVGIGTTSPTSVLDIRDTQTGAASEIKLFNLDQGNTTTQTSALVMTPDVRANGAKISVVKENADFSSAANKDVAITFAPVSNNTATERLRLDSSGNVGIGTTNPTQKLSLENGTFKISGTSTFASNVEIGRVGNGNNLAFATGGTERLRITSTGAWAIEGASNYGTSGQVLTSNGNDSPTWQDASGGGATDSISEGNTSVECVDTGSDGHITFDTEGSEKLRIDSSGNVGIGTSSPNKPLHIYSGSSDAEIRLQTNSGTEQNSYIALRQSSGDLDFYTVTSGTNMKFHTVNAERLRIDGSGNTGIGTTNPSEKLDVSGNAKASHILSDGNFVGRGNLSGSDSRSGVTTIGPASDTSPRAFMGAYAEFYGGAHSSKAGELKLGTGMNTAGPIIFELNTTEAGRFNSSGHFSIGTTATNPGDNNLTTGTSINANGKYFFSCANDGGHINRNNNGYILHARNNKNLVGGITVNSNSTAYNTSSDYRLKENVVDLDGAIGRVKQLAPKRFNFISAPDATVDGFLAHEAQTVVPEAVFGTHNEVDDDGNAVMQGIDQSKLVPLLTAALQEAIAKIETLETKVAALEAQ